MLRTIFSQENEQVQALDATTGVWYACRVMGFPSDWAVKIKWEGFKSKYNTATISVPVELQKKDRLAIEKWPIRKPIHPKTEERKDRKTALRAKATDSALGYVRKGCVRSDKASCIMISSTENYSIEL